MASMMEDGPRASGPGDAEQALREGEVLRLAREELRREPPRVRFIGRGTAAPSAANYLTVPLRQPITL